MLLKDNWFKLKKQYIVRFVTHASKMYDSSTKMRGKKWKHCHKVLICACTVVTALEGGLR